MRRPVDSLSRGGAEDSDPARVEGASIEKKKGNNKMGDGADRKGEGLSAGWLAAAFVALLLAGFAYLCYIYYYRPAAPGPGAARPDVGRGTGKGEGRPAAPELGRYTAGEILDKGRNRYEQGRIEDLERLLEEMEGMPRIRRPSPARAKFLFLRARAHLARGGVEEAAADVKEGLGMTADPSVRADGLVVRSTIRRAGGNVTGADEDLGEAARIYEEKLNSPLLACEALKLRAKERTLAGNLTGSLEDLDRIYKLSYDSGDRRRAAGALLLKSRVQRAAGDRLGAIKTLDPAIAFFASEEGRDPRTLARAYKDRAELRLELGVPSGAVRDLDRAIELFRGEAADPRLAVECLQAKAGLFVHREKHGVAVKVLGEALKIYESDLDDPLGLARVLAMIGESKFELRRFEEAREDFDRALGIVEKTGDRRAKAQILIGRSRLAYETGTLEESLGDIEEAVRILRTEVEDSYLLKRAENIEKQVEGIMEQRKKKGRTP